MVNLLVALVGGFEGFLAGRAFYYGKRRDALFMFTNCIAMFVVASTL